MLEHYRDHLAMERLREASKDGIQIRLSNKAAAGYWWCYGDGQVVQANDPADAILNIYRTIDAKSEEVIDAPSLESSIRSESNPESE